MVTLAIWGEVIPGAILTKCGLWGDMVDIITYAIFRDCRLRGVGVVRGVSLPSSIDLTRRPYNTGMTVWSTPPLTTSDKCHKLPAYGGPAASYWKYLACCDRQVLSIRRRRISRAVKPDIISESRFLPTPPAFDGPVRRLPSEYRHPVWYAETGTVWLPGGNKFRRYLYSFWQNVRTWRRDGQTYARTDTAWRHRPRLCIVSRGRNRACSSNGVEMVYKRYQLHDRSQKTQYVTLYVNHNIPSIAK